MFTGIIKELGKIKDVSTTGSNRTFLIQSPLASQLKVDESLAHNGVCLTVEEITNNIYKVTAIEETIKKTNVADWKEGDLINLEQAMQMNDRLDGHIVQGHVDGTGICVNKTDKNGSVEFTFQFSKTFAPLVIEKGSICVNGVSLTAFNVSEDHFSVAIIPYTFSHTNFQSLNEDDFVNLEFDLLGKYVARIESIRSGK